MKITAQEVYEKLEKDDKILTAKGRITFNLGDINIIVRQRDVVGNIMQEWVEGWLKKNNIDYSLNDNTQMPPDFYLDPDNKKHNLLEIKAFNYKAGPGFDIADFRMYEQEIKTQPWMLDVSYLIFGYDMSDDGIVTIKKMWLKKVWEISRPMISNGKQVWPINLQIKKGVVHKIRPAKWYAKSKDFNIFARIEDFLCAIEETVYKNVETRQDSHGWKQEFLENYQKFYGTKLTLPRWDEIENQYVLKK